MAKKSVASLSVDELCSYLLVKLPDLEGETIEAFRFHKVNGETFLQLTDDDIRELTARLGERKAIKRLIDSSPDYHLLAEPLSRSGPQISSFVSAASPATNIPHQQLPPQFYIAVSSSSSSGIHKTTHPDHSKGPQAAMHPVVQLRAPTVAAPAVPPRMLPATPPNIRSRGLSVTPPPVQMCTPPPVPLATPPQIAAPGSSSCWIKAFKIPDFSFRTQQALKNGVITKGASSDIVTYIAHHIWTHTKYPSSEEYTEVCRELVTQYPVLKDTTGTGYVSWKRRLQQKFKNLRRPNRGRGRGREGAQGSSSSGLQMGVVDGGGEGPEIDFSESDPEEDDKSNILCGDIYSITPPHQGGTPGEDGEPPIKKMRASPDQSTTVVHEATHAPRGDEFGPLHIEEMSSFYNDSSISSYQDGWPDVKIKMPALEET